MMLPKMKNKTPKLKAIIAMYLMNLVISRDKGVSPDSAVAVKFAI